MSHAVRTTPARFPVLNWVIDTLVLREWTGRTMSSWLEGQLDEWREAKKNRTERKDPLIVRMPTVGEFALFRPPNQHFEFWLRNPEVCDIYLHRPEIFPKPHCQQTGMWYVIFRSKFLQFKGWNGAKRIMKLLAAVLCGGGMCLEPNSVSPYQVISRADIAIDYQNPEPFVFQTFTGYVARASRLKIEGQFSPFGSDSRTAMETMLERESAKSVSQAKKTKNKEGVSQLPEGDNKGGLAYTTILNGFSGGTVEVTPSLAAKAADYAILEYLRLWSHEHQFEKTARLTRVIGSAESVQTAYFGRFNGPLYLREYNKRLSMMVDDKKWLLDIWCANGYDGESPVWRCEFSLSNQFLRQFWDHNEETGEGTGAHVDLSLPENFIEYIPTVWNYLTRTWVRHCIPPLSKDELETDRLEAIELILSTMSSDAPEAARAYLELEIKKLKARGVDENRSRWEPSERWLAIQNAWGNQRALMRLRPQPNPDPQRAISMAKGNLISALAKDVTPPKQPKREQFNKIEEWRQALEDWRKDVRDLIVTSSKDKLLDGMGTPETMLEFLKRRSIFGQGEFTEEQFNDTLMSNAARAAVIAQGGGS